MWLFGFILVIIGIVHINDTSASHLRFGWAALVVGTILILASLIFEKDDKDAEENE